MKTTLIASLLLIIAAAASSQTLDPDYEAWRDSVDAVARHKAFIEFKDSSLYDQYLKKAALEDSLHYTTVNAYLYSVNHSKKKTEVKPLQEDPFQVKFGLNDSINHFMKAKDYGSYRLKVRYITYYGQLQPIDFQVIAFVEKRGLFE